MPKILIRQKSKCLGFVESTAGSPHLTLLMLMDKQLDETLLGFPLIPSSSLNGLNIVAWADILSLS